MSSLQKILVPFLPMIIIGPLVASGTLAQDWTSISTPTNDWSYLVSSADGGRLFGADPAFIETSTNSGSTWTRTSAPFLYYWNSLACSADGSVIIASEYSGLYISVDSGTTWKLGSTNQFWSSVACSADGKKMVAIAVEAAGVNPVYVSTNSGADWVLTGTSNWGLISAPDPGRLAMSSDGSRLAIATGSSVDVSTNSGLTWTSTYPTTAAPLFVSASGQTLIELSGGRAPSPGLISTSSDWGMTWRPVRSLTNYLDCFCGACSADGSILAAVETSEFNGVNRLLLSTNSGASWSTTDLPWTTNLCSIASSADGNRIVAAFDIGFGFAGGGRLYVRQVTPTPELKVSSRSGNFGLSWLLPSKPFVLEESGDLVGWSPVTVAPVLNYTNLNYEWNGSTTAVSKFYRLTPK